MARKEKDCSWKAGPNDNGHYDYTQAQLHVLMDIRDELKRLNSVMYCYNTQQIPHTLTKILNKLPTKKPRKKRK